MNAIARKFLRATRMSAWILALAATVGTASAAPPDVPPKTSFSTDLTDTWWNPSESGWGMQMIQTGEFIFATVYVYGTDGKPMWFGGGMTPSGGTKFGGKAYVTSGPYFGGPFDPTAVAVREAGTMSFEATGSNTGVLAYTLDGVAVTKSVQRQPLALDNYNGTYATALTQTVQSCTDSSNNGTGTGLIALQITQNGSAMTLVTLNAAGGSCSITGTYSQAGRSGRVDGTYTCTSGEAGNAFVVEMNNHVRQFNAQLFFQSTNLGCVSLARLAGIIPD